MSRRWSVPLASGLAVLVIAGGIWSARRVLAETHRMAAERAFSRQDREEAADRLEKALSWMPGDAGTSLRLTEILIGLYEDRPEADGEALTPEGEELLRRVLAACETMLEASPADAIAWSQYGLASAYIAEREKLGRPLDLGRFRRSETGDLTYSERVAIGALDIAVELEPNNHRLWDIRADLLLIAGLRDQALAAFAQSARVMPVAVRHSWDRFERMPDDVAAAVAGGFEQALEEPHVIPASEIHRNLAELMFRRGDLEGAEGQYRMAVERSSDPTERAILHLGLGAVLEAAGRNREALEEYDRAEGPEVIQAEIEFRRGTILLGEGLVDEGLRALQSAIAETPERLRYRLVLARAAEDGGRPDLARSTLEKAAAASPRDPAPLEQLVRFHLRRGEVREAREGARKLVRLHSGNPRYKRLLE